MYYKFSLNDLMTISGHYTPERLAERIMKTRLEVGNVRSTVDQLGRENNRRLDKHEVLSRDGIDGEYCQVLERSIAECRDQIASHQTFIKWRQEQIAEDEERLEQVLAQRGNTYSIVGDIDSTTGVVVLKGVMSNDGTTYELRVGGRQ